MGWQDIAAWSDLTYQKLLPQEVEMLVAMDATYLSACSEERSEAQKKPESPKKSGKRR